MRKPVSTLAAWKAGLIAPAIALIAATGGCGGGGSSAGGGGSSPPPPIGGGNPLPDPPTANDATGGGIWLGTMRRNGQFVNWATCLVVEAGDVACILYSPLDEHPSWFSDDFGVGAVHGNLQVSTTSQASGTGKVYAMRGNVLTDGTSVVADFTITGGSLSTEDSRLEFTFSSLGEESTFVGFFDPAYVSLFDSLPHGVYTRFEIYGDPSSLSIDEDGVLFMQTASGCSGNGQVSLNTPGYNAYTVNITMSNCPGLNGAYEGLATFVFSNVDDDTASDVLSISVFNETNAIVGVAVR